MSTQPYLNEIDFVEALVIARLLNIQNADDVLMIEVTKQLHLPQGTQTEHAVIKGRDLLDRNSLSRGLMDGRAVTRQSATALKSEQHGYDGIQGGS